MKRKRGYTLIESLVAIGLAILLMLFIFTIFPNTHRALYNSENHSHAAFIGRSLINSATQAGFENVQPVTGSHSITGISNGHEYANDFDYQLNVQNIDDDRKQVWVTVSWDDKAQNKAVTLETIITRR